MCVRVSIGFYFWNGKWCREGRRNMERNEVKIQVVIYPIQNKME